MSKNLDFSKELIGRRALITGGTRGIGAAIAQRMLDAGAKVVVTARSRGETSPAGAVFVAGDVATAAGVKAIAAGALDALGGLDILVNNAGGARGFPHGTASIPDEEWQAGFDLNLFAAIRLTNALLPALHQSKGSAIVNISSGGATMAVGTVAHYFAAKAALNAYSRTLAIELAPSKIRVNVVSPGPVTTPGSREFSDALGVPPDLFAKEIPLGHYGAPDPQRRRRYDGALIRRDRCRLPTSSGMSLNSRTFVAALTTHRRQAADEGHGWPPGLARAELHGARRRVGSLRFRASGIVRRLDAVPWAACEHVNEQHSRLPRESQG
jgi:NAD(P)-dependent dehydrogenase (short-subunit alcohol dehydrogenase family)